LSRTLVVATGLLLCASVLSGTASADTLLQKKQAQYARVRSQVRKLDSHIELLTERYNQVRWHLHVLHREIHAATARLVAEEAELKRQQQNLAQLVIEQYKGGDPKTLEIVLGSSSLSQITNGMDLDRQVDTAVSDTVAAIDAARASIAHQRELLVIDRQASRVAKRRLEEKRRQIRHELRRRRRLEKEIGQQVKVIEAADQIGQGQLALQLPHLPRVHFGRFPERHDLQIHLLEIGQGLRPLPVAIEQSCMSWQRFGVTKVNRAERSGRVRSGRSRRAPRHGPPRRMRSPNGSRATSATAPLAAASSSSSSTTSA
jgi:hypothetical protein